MKYSNFPKGDFWALFSDSGDATIHLKEGIDYKLEMLLIVSLFTVCLIVK